MSVHNPLDTTPNQYEPPSTGNLGGYVQGGGFGTTFTVGLTALWLTHIQRVASIDSAVGLNLTDALLNADLC